MRTFDDWRDRVLSNPDRYTALKIARYRAGLHQTALASAASIHPGSLSAFEAPAGLPPKKRKTRAALATALGVAEQELWA